MAGMFRKGTRRKLKLRAVLDGPAGSGKTYTALRLGHALLRHERAKNPNHPNLRIAVIGTEGSAEDDAAEKYLGIPDPDAPGEFWDFDLCHLTSFAPSTYTGAMLDAAKQQYPIVIVDSLTHAWAGKDGALELKDQKATETHNQYTAWKDVTPMHNRMVDTILTMPAHIICTMRVKTDHVLEEVVNERGKTVQVPRKVGLAPIQRAGMEYEFDIYACMDWSHILTVTKTRCSAVDGLVMHKPGMSLAQMLIEWLETGAAENTIGPALGITDEQTARVTELLRELGKTLDAIKVNFPNHYGCQELHELSPANAADLIKRLESSLPKKPAPAKPPEPVPPPTPVKPAEPVPPPAPVKPAEPLPEVKQGDIPLADVHCELCSERDGNPVAHSPPACTPESLRQPNPAVPPTTLQMLATYDDQATPTTADADARNALLGQVRKLMRDLNFSEAMVQPILQKDYGTKSVDDLTADTAKKVIDRLTAKLAEKKAAKPARVKA